MAKSTKRKQRVRRSNLKKTVRGSQRLNRAVNNMKTTKKRRVRRVSRKGRKKSRQSGGKTGTYADAVNLFKTIFGPDALNQISNIDGIKVTEGEETVSGKHYMLISNLNNNQAVKFRHHFIGVTGCRTLQFKKALKVYIYGKGNVTVPLGFEQKIISLQKDPSQKLANDGKIKPGETGNSLTNIIYNTLNIERDKTGFKLKAADQSSDSTVSSGNPVYEEPVTVTEDKSLYVYSEADACHPNTLEEENQKAEELVNLALLEVTYADTGSAGQSSAQPTSGDPATYAVPKKKGNPAKVIVKKDGKEFLVDLPDEGSKEPKESKFKGETISVTRRESDGYNVIREDDDFLIVQKEGGPQYTVDRDPHLVMEGGILYEVPEALPHSEA